MPPALEVSAANASGWAMATWILSSFARLARPELLLDTHGEDEAWMETLMLGTAIRSFGPKSLMDLMLGLLVSRYMGEALVAESAFTP